MDNSVTTINGRTVAPITEPEQIERSIQEAGEVFVALCEANCYAIPPSLAPVERAELG